MVSIQPSKTSIEPSATVDHLGQTPYPSTDSVIGGATVGTLDNQSGPAPSPSNMESTPSAYMTDSVFSAGHKSPSPTDATTGLGNSSQFAMQNPTSSDIPTSLLSSAITPSKTLEDSVKVSMDSKTVSPKPSQGHTSSSPTSDQKVGSSVVSDSLDTETSSAVGSTHSPAKTQIHDSVDKSSVTKFESDSADAGLSPSEYTPGYSELDSATPYTSASGSSVRLTETIPLTPMVPTDFTHSAKLPSSQITSTQTFHSRDLFPKITPSKTVYMTPKHPDNTDAVYSSSVIPPLPPVTKTPGGAADGTKSPFGGETSEMILYIAVPLCAVGLLIMLIVLAVCLRKRKAKAKGSPGRAYVQDLWLNSRDPVRNSQRSLSEGTCTSNDNLLNHSKLPVEPTYEVIYDFPGEIDSHLSLKKGDIVHVSRKEDNGWWRGTKGDSCGWFPSNNVLEIPPDSVKRENEIQKYKSEGPVKVSSFLVKRRPESDIISEEGLLNSHKGPVMPEPIYQKIVPKNQRNGDQNGERSTPNKHPVMINRESTPVSIDDQRFIVVYPYSGHFSGEISLEKGDIIVGKERDRNGWMRGVKEGTEEEGWFPSVYVDELKEGHPLLGHAEYKELDANKTADHTKDLVGILHKTLYPFRPEKTGDLGFGAGETVAVVQILENGWWLGCKGDEVGWFPGNYVQIAHTCPVDSRKSDDNLPNSKPDKSPVCITVEVKNTGPEEDHESPAPRVLPKPKRVAPPTPESKIPVSPGKAATAVSESRIPVSPGSRIPKLNRPNRPAPPPPTSGQKSVLNEDNKDISKEKKELDIHDKDTHSKFTSENETDVKHSDLSTGKKKVKPEVPKRSKNPNVITIPRNTIKVQSGMEIGKSVPPPRPPPPPRPNSTKLTPLKHKLLQDETESHSPSSGDEPDPLFTFKSPRNFDSNFLMDTTDDVDFDDSYSKRLTTFGDHPDRSEGIYETIKTSDTSPDHLSTGTPKPTQSTLSPKPAMSTFSGIPKLQKQQAVEEPRSSYDVVEDLGPERLMDDVPKDDKETNKIQDSEVALKEQNIYQEVSEIQGVPENNKTSVEDEKVEEIVDVPRNPVGSRIPKFHTKPATPHKPEDLDLSKTAPTSRIPIAPTATRTPTTPPASNIRTTPTATKISMIPPPSRITADSKGQLAYDDSSDISPVEEELHRMPEDGVGTQDSESSPISDSSESNLSSRYSPLGADKNATDPDHKHDELPESGKDKPPPVAPKPKPKVLPKPKVSAKHLLTNYDSDDAHVKSNDRDTGNSPNERTVTPPSDIEQPKHSPVLNEDSTELKGKDVDIAPHIVQPVESTSVIPSEGQSGEKKSRIPMGSKIAQKSPTMKTKHSKIPAPSPKLKRKDSEEKTGTDSQVSRKLSESDVEASKVDSPNKTPVKPPRKQNSTEKDGVPSKPGSDLRQRSNSPRGRTGIPTSGIRQRSNSPSSKLSSPLSQRSQSPATKIAKPKSRQRSLSRDKEVNSDPAEVHAVQNGAKTPDLSESNTHKKGAKPPRPKGPPRDRSLDSKKGKSLLPVVQRSLSEQGSPAGSKSKGHSGIPVSKPPRPPPLKSPAVERTKSHEEEDGNPTKGLKQAVKGYRARGGEELTFDKGSFIMEISDCDRSGWCVGMLADGTTGLFPVSHVAAAPGTDQSEA